MGTYIIVSFVSFVAGALLDHYTGKSVIAAAKAERDAAKAEALNIQLKAKADIQAAADAVKKAV